MQQTSKAKQFHCDVVVFSNLKAHFGESQLDDVVKGLTKMDVELKVGVTVDKNVVGKISRTVVVHDGISNSVADYNSLRVGVVLVEKLMVHKSDIKFPAPDQLEPT